MEIPYCGFNMKYHPRGLYIEACSELMVLSGDYLTACGLLHQWLIRTEGTLGLCIVGGGARVGKGPLSSASRLWLLPVTLTVS